MTSRARSFRTDERGVTPAISKAMEAAVVVLFVAGMTTALYGGTIPAYRTTAAAEVADRTVAAAATQLEAAVPPHARAMHVVRRISLPTTIRGANYRVTAREGTLVLDHPDARLHARARLALPARVVRVTGTWESGADLLVVVSGTADGVTVRLTDRAATAADTGPDGDEP